MSVRGCACVTKPPRDCSVAFFRLLVAIRMQLSLVALGFWNWAPAKLGGRGALLLCGILYADKLPRLSVRFEQRITCVRGCCLCALSTQHVVHNMPPRIRESEGRGLHVEVTRTCACSYSLEWVRDMTSACDWTPFFTGPVFLL